MILAVLQGVSPGPESVLPILPGYVVLRQLGKGHSVWLAEELVSGLRVRVAVRVGGPETTEALLLREIVSLSRVRSPHVAAYRNCLRTADGACAVITEYVDGKPLAAVLSCQPNGRLQWHPLSGSSVEVSAKGFIMDLLSGLSVLHSVEPPIVHRKVTPANVLVVGSKVVITDLRLSSLSSCPISLDCDEPYPFGEQLYGSFKLGTGNYMSPELADGTVGWDGLDARADVWAAGVMLHEALSGKQLFPQVAPT
jgi:serine/threonine protein kinase